MRAKTVLAKTDDREAGQGSNAGECFDENGEQWLIGPVHLEKPSAGAR
jgi:hypothetical protein